MDDRLNSANLDGSGLPKPGTAQTRYQISLFGRPSARSVDRVAEDAAMGRVHGIVSTVGRSGDEFDALLGKPDRL